MEHLWHFGRLRILQKVPHNGPQPPNYICSEVLISFSLIKQPLLWKFRNDFLDHEERRKVITCLFGPHPFLDLLALSPGNVSEHSMAGGITDLINSKNKLKPVTAAGPDPSIWTHSAQPTNTEPRTRELSWNIIYGNKADIDVPSLFL